MTSEPVSVPVTVTAEGSTYEFVADLIYTAKAGRKGTAK